MPTDHPSPDELLYEALTECDSLEHDNYVGSIRDLVEGLRLLFARCKAGDLPGEWFDKSTMDEADHYAKQVTTLKAELAEAREAQNPDLTNAQYHAVLDELWKVVSRDDPGEQVWDKLKLKLATVTEERDLLQRRWDRCLDSQEWDKLRADRDHWKADYEQLISEPAYDRDRKDMERIEALERERDELKAENVILAGKVMALPKLLDEARALTTQALNEKAVAQFEREELKINLDTPWDERLKRVLERCEQSERWEGFYPWRDVRYLLAQIDKLRAVVEAAQPLLGFLRGEADAPNNTIPAVIRLALGNTEQALDTEEGSKP